MPEQPPPPGGSTPPPPGWQPDPGPTTPPPRPPGLPPAPPREQPVHRPGAVPLRPLGLADVYDATFRIIRMNPQATVGSAVLVSAVAMAGPVLLTALFVALLRLAPGTTAGGVGDDADVIGIVGAAGSLLAGSILMSLGLVLVTGMIAHVVMAAALGLRLTLGQAWRATHGKRWRLLGLTVLLALLTLLLLGGYVGTWFPVVALAGTAMTVVYGVVTVPLFLALVLVFWIRVYYLAAAALVLEDVGILGSLARGVVLTRGQFWRTFGIALLTWLVAQVAGSMLSVPFSVVAQLAPFLAGGTGTLVVLVTVLASALGSVVAAAFVAPFTTTVAAVQYLDLRMRNEALDVELLARTGAGGPDLMRFPAR